MRTYHMCKKCPNGSCKSRTVDTLDELIKWIRLNYSNWQRIDVVTLLQMIEQLKDMELGRDFDENVTEVLDEHDVNVVKDFIDEVFGYQIEANIISGAIEEVRKVFRMDE